MTEPVPKVGIPKTDVPFLDPEPVSEPGVNGDGPSDMVPGESPVTGGAALRHETSDGPCADCAKYAQIGYIAGAVVGIAAGGIVAYVILRNRLAPA